MYRPDGISQMVPAEVDCFGMVMDGLVEGQRTGAREEEPGLLSVAVRH